MDTAIRCSSYWKGRLRVNLDYGRQLYFLLYDSTYDWTPVSWAIVENSNHYTNEPKNISREMQLTII